VTTTGEPDAGRAEGLRWYALRYGPRHRLSIAVRRGVERHNPPAFAGGLLGLTPPVPYDQRAGGRAVTELVESIAKALVEHPEQVRVTQVAGTRAVVLELHVAPEDRGRIIGKQGRIVEAVQAVLQVAATRHGKRVTLVVV
jgi:uncharacterized protein